MEQWNNNFKWFFIRKAFGKIKYLDNDDVDEAKKMFSEMYKNGALSNPPYKWAEQLRDDIVNFIG